MLPQFDWKTWWATPVLTGSSSSWRTAVMTAESAAMTDDDVGTDDWDDDSGNDAGDCVVDNA